MTTQPKEQLAGPEQHKSDFRLDYDNLDAELAKVPLFMNQLPDEENETLTALQSLVFDGTPEGKQNLFS
ncbi:hypothetical protein BCR42DRAFT_57070 [Absidia repens]|uniref:Uncharacterized protein n=1 Tax=Absidia repens TaxID=90262 RepID=A0A1X2IDZ0_9FUNG|nr:hypothetical protein BCR42DRAFT_57070 [Absidia repens]